MSPRIALVCFAFGAARVGPGGPLAGPVLMQLLADLELSDSAARSLLLRMRRQGWLSSERVGRQARYTLAPILDRTQERLQRQLSGERPAWSGSFSGVLYTVPERHRAFRDRLRYSAQLLGYVTLRPGLVVATSDRCQELISLLPTPPPGSRILPLRLTLSDQDSRQAAAELWGLDALAARYRTVLADARARTRRAQRHPPDGRAAFTAFAAATLPVFEAGAADPDLPAALLPTAWPGQRFGAVLGRAFAVFGPLVADYLATLNDRDQRSRLTAVSRGRAGRTISV